MGEETWVLTNKYKLLVPAVLGGFYHPRGYHISEFGNLRLSEGLLDSVLLLYSGLDVGLGVSLSLCILDSLDAMIMLSIVITDW